MDLPGLAKQALRDAGIPFDHLSGIQMNRAPHGEPCLVMLLFTGGTNPTAVLRASTDPKHAATFSSAYENLKRLKAALPAHFSYSVPDPYLFEKKNGVTIFLESAQHGTPIQKLPPNRYFRSVAFEKDFLAVVDWLVAFNTSLRIDQREVSPTQRRTLLNDPIAAYRQRFTVSQELSLLLHETEETLSNATFALAPRHADFCTANVLVDRDHAVRVIDWEHELTPMWPFCDLLHFMSSVWCIRYGRTPAALQRNYHALFFTQTHLTKTLQQGVRRYAQSWGLKPKILLPLSTITWVHHALQKADYIETFARSEKSARQMMIDAHILTLVEHNQCLNLEILATNRAQYIVDQI